MFAAQYQHQYFLFADSVKQEELNSKNIDQFFNPQYWQQQGRILGSAQGRGTTYFLATKDLFGMNTALRHYYRGGLWGKINRDHYAFPDCLNKTRSFAEFLLLDRLYQAGIAVPQPIAAKVEKTLFGYRADLITQRIEQAKDLTDLLQTQDLSGQAWEGIGKLIAQLHQEQICHTDLNAHNILVQNFGQNNEKYWLLDFDKCGQKAGQSWKKENLARLHRSFIKEVERMKIRFNEDCWQSLLKGYQSIS